MYSSSVDLCGAKVNVICQSKYHGHVFQKMAVVGGFVFHKHILFNFQVSSKALYHVKTHFYAIKSSPSSLFYTPASKKRSYSILALSILLSILLSFLLSILLSVTNIFRRTFLSKQIQVRQLSTSCCKT